MLIMNSVKQIGWIAFQLSIVGAFAWAGEAVANHYGFTPYTDENQFDLFMYAASIAAVVAAAGLTSVVSDFIEDFKDLQSKDQAP